MQTIVRSIRVDRALWERLGKQAEEDHKSRNCLIAEVLESHCEKKSENSVDKEEQVC